MVMTKLDASDLAAALRALADALERHEALVREAESAIDVVQQTTDGTPLVTRNRLRLDYLDYRPEKA